jgi:uncharacterized membrane protein (UPF0136 family)
MENQGANISVSPNRSWGLILVAVITILFGLAEVATNFTQQFFSITTSAASISIITGVIIGACYIASGILVITFKRWGIETAVVLLCVDIAGRVILVVSGYYPLNSSENIIGIVGGTAIAGLIAIYLTWKLKTLK